MILGGVCSISYKLKIKEIRRSYFFLILTSSTFKWDLYIT